MKKRGAEGLFFIFENKIYQISKVNTASYTTTEGFRVDKRHFNPKIVGETAREIAEYNLAPHKESADNFNARQNEKDASGLDGSDLFARQYSGFLRAKLRKAQQLLDSIDESDKSDQTKAKKETTGRAGLYFVIDDENHQIAKVYRVTYGTTEGKRVPRHGILAKTFGETPQEACENAVAYCKAQVETYSQKITSPDSKDNMFSRNGDDLMLRLYRDQMIEDQVLLDSFDEDGYLTSQKNKLGQFFVMFNELFQIEKITIHTTKTHSGKWFDRHAMEGCEVFKTPYDADANEVVIREKRIQEQSKIKNDELALMTNHIFKERNLKTFDEIEIETLEQFKKIRDSYA